MTGHTLVHARASAAALLSVLCVLYTIYKRRFRRPRGIPLVPGLPVLGNAVEFLRAIGRHRHLHMLWGWHKAHGDTFTINIPFTNYMVDTIDPRNVEHMLKTNFDNYIKGDWLRDRLKELLGDGIFNVDGAKWSAQRKLASHMFTHKQFKGHIWRVVERNCGKVTELLRSSQPGQVVDIFNVMNRFTLDTIGEVGFAKDISSLANADSPFLKSFDRAQQICMLRFTFADWRLRRFFRIGQEGELRRHLRLLSDYSRATVRELVDDPSGEKGDSFVGLFVADAKARGELPDEEFLRDMVLNFLIAGRDTTAQAISWCLFLISQNPEVERRMLEEVNEVAGHRDLAYDDLSRLTYVQAVVNEGLRLYPSVPLDSKISVNDDTLPDGTFVPRGTILQYNAYCMGRSRQIWGDDAESFRPERWVGADFPSLYTYPVFNAGPRECLGKRLAWVEIKSCLVAVLRAVRLTLAVDPESIEYDMQLSLGMSSGLPCTVMAR